MLKANQLAVITMLEEKTAEIRKKMTLKYKVELLISSAGTMWRTGWSGGFRHFRDMTPRREAAHSVVHVHSHS